MTSFIRIQDEKTKRIKKYQIDDMQVSEFVYWSKFDFYNSIYKYNSSSTKRNIKTGDYVHFCTLS